VLIPLVHLDPAWLVLRTKPKQERSVLDTLAARNVEAYCPRLLEPRWHPRSPQGPVPLFPSYIFARHGAGESLAALDYCPGGAGVLRFAGLLAALEDEGIAALRAREGERGYVVLGEVRRGFARGSRARVVGGPMAGFEGVVTRYMRSSDRVRLLLSVVSSVRTVELDARHVRCA
jgi:transcription antitermination factor NusG